MLHGGQRGYAMAALLVGLAIASVLMSAAMPVWKTLAIREKEEEFVFRAGQYQRAIGLFQRKAGPGVLPPTVDVLVEQRFLRKKYKDPITNDDFELLRQGQAAPGSTAPGLTSPTTPGRGTPGSPAAASGSIVGGIVGVTSKSKAKSLRVFNGRTAYNEWQAVFIPPQPTAGANGTAGPGGRGGRGGLSNQGGESRPPGGGGRGPGDGRFDPGARPTPPPSSLERGRDGRGAQPPRR